MYYTEYLVCSDSFKGSLSSHAVNSAIADGIRSVCPSALVRCVTMSDGGEGFVEAVRAQTGGELITVSTHDPLMHPLQAKYLLSADGTAYIESASTCGIELLTPDELAPVQATSYGLGELMADALQRGCGKMVIGLGGTCTCDVGKGMLHALCEVLKVRDLAYLSKMFATCPVMIASDVENPLLGSNGAAHVFSPQKGASPAEVELLEQYAETFAKESAMRCGYDSSKMAGAGAAGGIGYALMQYLHAERMPGIELLLELCGLDVSLHERTLIITGEGHADRQTLMGKVPLGVLQHALRRGAAVWLLAGKVKDRAALLDAGFARVININDHLCPGENPMQPEVAYQNLRKTVCCEISKQE